jgi:6-phosphogluconolactonase
MTAAPPEFVVATSAEQLSDDVAGRFVATVVAAQAVRPLAFVAVTGGGILEQVMRTIAQLPSRDSVDWGRVSLWWADERFVPADSDDRNDKAAFAALFAQVALDPANVHRMPASDGVYGDDVEAAAAGYAADLASAAQAAAADDEASAGADRDIPQFDVILLGIGPDGHCASLFPGHPATRETAASIVAVHDSPKPPPTRTSFTFRALDSANEVWFIASGAGKAEAVELACSASGPQPVPSAEPRGQHRTLWLIDEDAAAQLPASVYSPATN